MTESLNIYIYVCVCLGKCVMCALLFVEMAQNREGDKNVETFIESTVEVPSTDKVCILVFVIEHTVLVRLLVC